jgi:hypothetical protein
LFGNNSILINKIVPENFEEYWNVILKPLFKPNLIEDTNADADTSTSTLNNLKEKLHNIVTVRDNVGEMCWYLYTAALLIVITQYSISSMTCSTDLKTMQANRNAYLTKKDNVEQQNKKATSTTYTS